MSESLNHERYLEIFLVYKLEQNFLKQDVGAIFALPINLVFLNISKMPLFFDVKSLMHYMSFTDTHYSILRAYVPDIAIEGCFDGLYLKKDQLEMKQIQGCFIDIEKLSEYHINPKFDEGLLALVKAREEDL